MPTRQRVASYVLAAGFLLQGGLKVAGLERDAFARWGYPEWFMYAVAAYELALAAAFLAPAALVRGHALRFWAAVAALPLMIGAAATHVRLGEYAILPLPVAFFGVAAWLAYVTPRGRTARPSP